MINIPNSYFLILIVRSILQLVLTGVLVTELFNHKRKNKLDIAWLLLIMFLFMAFMWVNEYVIFSETVSLILGWVGIAFLATSLTLFTIFIIMRFSFLNKILVFPTGILAFVVLVIASMNVYRPIPIVILPMFVAILIVAVVGTFVYIDFMIKTSGGKK